MDDVPRTVWYRILEIIPGALSWLFLIGPLVASFWYPRAVGIFIIFYIIFWFLRSHKSGVFLLYSYFKSKKYAELDWFRLLNFFSDAAPIPHSPIEHETAERIGQLQKKGVYKKWHDIYHVVIVATYKEEKEILETTLEAISRSMYPLKKIIVVLATEERDRERAEKNAAYLTKKFGHVFGQFHHFMHPAHMQGEIPGKGGNITFSGRHIAKILHDKHIDPSNVLVTTVDADNILHKTYFSNLTYHYLMEPEREKKSYQPLLFYYNNIWDIPLANRLISISHTFWHAAKFGEPYHLRTAACHAQSLDTLQRVNFWSCQTTNEDSHQFWRTYFYFHGDHEVIPLFVPVYQDAVQGKTYWASLVSQYRQLRRWAASVADIPYVYIKTKREWKSLPIFKTLDGVVHLTYSHILWATGPIIIILNKSLLTFLNPAFSTTVFAYNLGYLFNIFFTIALFGIPTMSMWLMLFLSVPKPKGRYARLKFLSIILQWFLLPFVIIIYGAIPTLEAQTRLMINKRHGFQVTEKVRK